MGWCNQRIQRVYEFNCDILNWSTSATIMIMSACSVQFYSIRLQLHNYIKDNSTTMNKDLTINVYPINPIDDKRRFGNLQSQSNSNYKCDLLEFETDFVRAAINFHLNKHTNNRKKKLKAMGSQLWWQPDIETCLDFHSFYWLHYFPGTGKQRCLDGPDLKEFQTNATKMRSSLKCEF